MCMSHQFHFIFAYHKINLTHEGRTYLFKLQLGISAVLSYCLIEMLLLVDLAGMLIDSENQIVSRGMDLKMCFEIKKIP